jgi:hypothetical protein
MCPACPVPQVQYGYIALEEIFRDSTRMSLGSLFGLLFAKASASCRHMYVFALVQMPGRCSCCLVPQVAATSVCVGGGLVGGLFAPSLFLGALVGDIMASLLGDSPTDPLATLTLLTGLLDRCSPFVLSCS